MLVENKTTRLIYGPPAPTVVQPFKFHPGSNEVDSEYWDFCSNHRNFKRDVLDTKLVAVRSQAVEISSQLKQLPNLIDFDKDGVTKAIELAGADLELLLRWAKADDRDWVKQLLAERIADFQ